MSKKLEAAIESLRESKKAEADAKKIRVAAEETIAKLVKFDDTGSKTFTEAGYKFEVKRPLNRTLDEAAWAAIENEIPEDRRCVRSKLSLDAKGFSWIQENDPSVFKLIAQAVTSKPGKVSVTIKEVL